jgi:hypothetical protein
MTEAEFARYIRSFNEMDYDTMVGFYADDVVLELPGATPHGPEGIKTHYGELHRHVRELLHVEFLLLGDDKLATELYTEFHCIRDLPTFSLQPGGLVRGEIFRCTNMVHYAMRGGRFSAIRVGRYKVHGADHPRPAALDGYGSDFAGAGAQQ